jgi:hypothetical protein
VALDITFVVADRSRLGALCAPILCVAFDVVVVGRPLRGAFATHRSPNATIARRLVLLAHFVDLPVLCALLRGRSLA